MEKKEKPRKRKMTWGEALKAPPFWYKLFLFIGFISIIAGAALIAEGNLGLSQASEDVDPTDTEEIEDQQEITEESFSTMSQGYGAIAVGLTFIGVVLFIEFLLGNIYIFGKKKK